MKRPRIRSWLRRVALAGAAGLVLLAVAGAAWQAIATRRIERQHPPPGRLVDVGGHRLHVHVRGAGSPTVVIDAGLSGASYDWETVAGGIASFAQVCTYDRAGYGWSDSGPRPRTTQHVVEELRSLLANAGLRPPFVLLGHSWGGLNLRYFASRHPDEVVGLILVDALNTDLDMRAEMDGSTPLLYTVLNHLAFLGPQRLVTPGIIREPAYDPPAREFRLAMLNRTRSTHAIYDELTGQANWLEVRAALRHLGDLPVTVVTTQQDSARATNGSWIGGPGWIEAQHVLTNISHRSRLVVAGTTEHDIQFHRPDQIVAAVREMLTTLRETRK
ncbi:MAG: alpha/beta hydrolase [Limisphaerales bacterium]